MPILLHQIDTTMLEVLKEIFAKVPQGFAQGLIMNGTIITIVYLIFWRWLKNKLKNWRIQMNQRADAAQIKREMINALGTTALAAVFSSIVFYLSLKGYTKVYTNYNDHSPFFAIAGFFIFLLIDDAWFYWMHRLLHHPKIYKYVHAVHHKSIDVTPYTSVSFHAVEPFLLTIWILPAAFIFPMYMHALAVLQVYGLLDNIKSHIGYEFFPAKFNKGWLRFLTASTYHNMHHSKFNGNYGVHFRFWDKLMGTEFYDYEQTFDSIQQRKKGLVDNATINSDTTAIANVLINYKGTQQAAINEAETILDALIRQNINVPYACKKGNCGTCKCTLLKGEVNIKLSKAITEEEINSGLILICQSTAITADIEIKIGS